MLLKILPCHSHVWDGNKVSQFHLHLLLFQTSMMSSVTKFRWRHQFLQSSLSSLFFHNIKNHYLKIVNEPSIDFNKNYSAPYYSVLVLSWCFLARQGFYQSYFFRNAIYFDSNWSVWIWIYLLFWSLKVNVKMKCKMYELWNYFYIFLWPWAVSHSMYTCVQWFLFWIRCYRRHHR